MNSPGRRLLLAVALAVGLVAGCAGGSKSTKSSSSAKEAADQTSEEERTPSAPKPEKLADSPCGNPDWAKMPKDHEIDGDPEPESEAGPEQSDDESSDANQSRGDE